MDFDQNNNTFERMGVVDYYSNNKLFEPEKQILSIIQDGLCGSKVLDLGVGAGRTTPYFSKNTELYVGIDYSSDMIKKCNERYGNHKNIIFKVADARQLSNINDDYFDLVLFSYNGLDYMNITDRTKSLQEISRVLREGGGFIFSTHNLNNIPVMLKLYTGINPKVYFRRLIKVIKLVYHNGLSIKYENLDYHYFKDNSHKFGLMAMYVKLSFQIDVLGSLGYESVRAFSSNAGLEIKLTDLGTYDEPWIYFYCLK